MGDTVRVVGDIHGDFFSYQKAIESAPKSIQVGDFGFGFYPERDVVMGDWLRDRPQHRFIRGNHDGPEACRRAPGYIPDGTVENDTMFIGGAWSIDQYRRFEGFDWWRDEECSVEEFYRFIDVYATARPRVMFTHDAPLSVTDRLFVRTGKAIFGKNAKSIKTLTGMALETMFETHQPEFWFFGHWHHTVSETIEGTQFQCIGENDYVDFDGERIIRYEL